MSNNVSIPPAGQLNSSFTVIPIAAGTNGATSADAVSLTPDALMAYCQSRLKSIDDQMRGGFDRQQLRIREGTDLQGVLEAFQRNPKGTDGKNDPQMCHNMEAALRNEIEKLIKNDPSFPGIGKLKQTYNDLVGTGTGDAPPDGMPLYEGYPPNKWDHDSNIDEGEMQAFVTSIQGSISTLNSGAEIEMIQMQSLMSQRQTAVQLTTNLVQALGDQANKIAQNIGH